MRRVTKMLEWMLRGALMGGFVGIVSGYVEYVLIRMNNTYVGNLTAAYWDIMIPYALIGLIGGGLIALLVGVVSGGSREPGRVTARIAAVLAACVPLAYLTVRATYNIVSPLWHVSNILGYLAALVAALVTGWLFYHAMRFLLSRMARGGANAFWRVAAPVVLAAAILLVLVVPSRFVGHLPAASVALQTGAQGDEAQTQPNIIFILIDTLRAYHLPMYGYSRPTAPRLTALAENGMTFKRMYAPASATRPSVASLFSSLYPAVHKTNYERDYLPDSIVTLAEVLRDGGYQSIGIAANPNVSPVFGFAQGFDHYEMASSDSAFKITTLGSVAEDTLGRKIDALFAKGDEFSGLADNMTDITLRRIVQREQKPTFLYVHYIDPHWPYTPPKPYDKAFDAERTPSIRQPNVDPLSLVSDRVPQDKVSHTLDQYDGEILFADHHIARLLDGLEQAGMLKNAMIIVTSDHGEEFWEHGQRGHDKSLYEEVLHIPFLLSWPGRIPAGSTFDEMTNLVDVMPTILDMVGLKAVPGLQGFSMKAQLLQQAPANPQRKFFAQQKNDQRAIEMVRHHRYKFIRHLRGPQQGVEEFYDLERDPLERTNLASLAQTHVAAWRTELDLFAKLAEQANLLVVHQQVDKLDEGMVKALRALGYLQ